MPGTIKDQINAMIDTGGPTEPPSTDPPGTDSPGTDAPSTDAPSTSAPVTDAPSTDAPVTTAPATDAPTTAAPEDDALSKALTEIDGLKQTVDELTKKKEKPAATAAPTTAPPVEDISFISEDIDPRDMTREDFNKILNVVYKAGEKSRRKSQEDTLRSIPQIVKSNVVTQTTLKKATEDFYTNNKDLLPFKKAVAQVYEELASENPDWKLGKMFEELEKETRTRLDLQRKATVTNAPVTATPKGPKFPKTKTTRTKPKPKTGGLLKEIDDMNAPLE